MHLIFDCAQGCMRQACQYAAAFCRAYGLRVIISLAVINLFFTRPALWRRKFPACINCLQILPKQAVCQKVMGRRLAGTACLGRPEGPGPAALRAANAALPQTSGPEISAVKH